MTDQNSKNDLYVIRHGNLLHLVSHVATLDSAATGSPAEAATVAHLESLLGDNGIAKLSASAGTPAAVDGMLSVKTDGMLAAKQEGLLAAKPGLRSIKPDGLRIGKPPES